MLSGWEPQTRLSFLSLSFSRRINLHGVPCIGWFLWSKFPFQSRSLREGACLPGEPRFMGRRCQQLPFLFLSLRAGICLPGAPCFPARCQKSIFVLEVGISLSGVQIFLGWWNQADFFFCLCLWWQEPTSLGHSAFCLGTTKQTLLLSLSLRARSAYLGHCAFLLRAANQTAFSVFF